MHMATVVVLKQKELIKTFPVAVKLKGSEHKGVYNMQLNQSVSYMQYIQNDHIINIQNMSYMQPHQNVSYI